MWWLIALLVLAVIAFFIVKTMNSQGSQPPAQTGPADSTGKLESTASSLENGVSDTLESGESAMSASGASDASASGASGTSKGSESGGTSTSGESHSQSSAGSHASTSDADQSSTVTASARTAVAATAAAVTAAASTAAGSGTATGTAASIATSAIPNGGDTASDVREMIKILNLDGPDATRLQISREQLVALRKGDAAGFPDTSTLDDVAGRLRQMLA